MMKYRKMLKSVTFLLLLCYSCVYVFGVVSELSELQSSNKNIRVASQKKILENQAKLIDELIRYASADVKPNPKPHPDFPDSYPRHDSKHLAILLLGELRAISAIPICINNIGYKNKKYLVFDGELLPLDVEYPAVEALIKIGLPAVDPVIEKLGTYDKECQGRMNCVWIIKNVLGIYLGRCKLQRYIEKTTDETIKKNLQAIMPQFSKLQEKLAEKRYKESVRLKELRKQNIKRKK
jgi:hypothetical protein